MTFNWNLIENMIVKNDTQRWNFKETFKNIFATFWTTTIIFNWNMTFENGFWEWNVKMTFQMWHVKMTFTWK